MIIIGTMGVRSQTLKLLNNMCGSQRTKVVDVKKKKK